MGYGIVLTLDDTQVRADGLPAPALTEDLVAVLGTDSYPSGFEPAASGPWQSVGAFHSNELAGFKLTAGGLTRLPLRDLDVGADSAAWQRVLAPRDFAEVARTLQRHPPRGARLAAARSDMVDGYFGPDRSVRSLRSVWWFYADAVGSVPADLDATVMRMMNCRVEAGASCGSYANALNKVGALVSDDDVTLVWSGNRLCRPLDLTAPEQERVRARA